MPKNTAIRKVFHWLAEVAQALIAPFEALDELSNVPGPQRWWWLVVLIVVLLGYWLFGWRPRSDYVLMAAWIGWFLCCLGSLHRSVKGTETSMGEIHERCAREVREIREQFVRELGELHEECLRGMQEIRELHEATSERTQRVRLAIMEVAPQVADAQRRIEHTESVLSQFIRIRAGEDANQE
jgi:hypothetical protein